MSAYRRVVLYWFAEPEGLPMLPAAGVLYQITNIKTLSDRV